MRTIAHISDLHFGRTNAAVLEGLRTAIVEAKPEVVVVSGDLTQRARKREFQEAKRFLDTLPRPQIVVPGNHDVPLYNILKRWLAPLSRFRRYISADLAPFYADATIAVAGINTARSLTIKNGRINSEQVEQVCARFAALNGVVIRIVVTHHPFALPEAGSRHAIVGRARMAMAAFADCKVDVVLSGHLHVSQTVTSEILFAGPHAALLVQAGTSSSSRRRSEANAFNLLRVERDRIEIEHHGWATPRFRVVAVEQFRRSGGGWSKITETGP
jgi:3',5'-cyclic AMP phosphodiesterase CpdA